MNQAALNFGMGGHQNAGNGEAVWLTPPALIRALGPFDLDPCFSEPRPWATAATHYGPDAAGGLGGLHAPWNGFVWCNPPYDQFFGLWLDRCADHGNALALVFARTETVEFHRTVWRRADAVFFFEGRLTFHHPSGQKASANGGAPSVLVAYGSEAIRRIDAAKLRGQLIRLDRATVPA
ncbi:phage N-6-adenine-methyltransferase [Mesorhizobium sp. BH1-1-5]|uniref:phage N-6-adenine-methyltransferase n=1 Tax=Mesorhizobium sp. BH1-1-5 TaxID=2876661 RepID=UPI001CD03F96|nr:phage N-6-adenine-methyltransferase [Mesorhizobium sp. BH1-1-5]MBZ9985693.1 phage N-6-adenine-methyltransferase [Mesorhizobium sp. BH1-1-5]